MSTRSLPLAAGRLLSLALFAAALVTACGADPMKLTDEGYSALNSGRYETALARFDSALAKDPDSLEARMGTLRARAYLDPESAARDFLELASSLGLPADQYRALVADLTTARAYAQALDVLEAGKAKFPDDPRWQAQIQIVGDRLTSEGADEDQLARLRGLGYIGN